MNDELNGHSCHNAGRIEKHTDGLVKEVVWKLDREVGKARCSKLLEVQRLKKRSSLCLSREGSHKIPLMVKTRRYNYM